MGKPAKPARSRTKSRIPPRRPARLLVAGLVLALVLGGLALVGAAARIERAARGRVRSVPENLPVRRVAPVLGCSPRVRSGAPNLYFQHRIQAAAELMRAGRVEYLLLSGDNHRRGYDEPTAMRDALEALGIPRDRLVLDYAGFSTFDSVVRARRVFGLTRALVVSQADHAARAVYLGDCTGLELEGYAARDVGLRQGWKTRLREALARVRAILDVTVLRRSPRFLGPPVPIGIGAGEKNQAPGA